MMHHIDPCAQHHSPFVRQIVMRSSVIVALIITVALGPFVAGASILFFGMYTLNLIPDLSRSGAAELISQAPEFNHRAKLIAVKWTEHSHGSMAAMSYASFWFRSVDSPKATPLIRARAFFQYWDATWHFRSFSYGRRPEGHVVEIDSEPVNNQ